ncbi:hypothetical protein AV274_5301 [Blastocystis sp. ATCC 50177/Nand II]|uniref:Uncharacterized protein n=1 Tax=Blastocystis sp. subtype 1 (strain ATCC 50177 / NandII) TaxID=478820 RepID=A0A196S7J4_BLAHN|nr:hypothetical protein AV274_5301 [Blastocystis sp. ATCC 50177/Nand II]
MQQPVEDDKLLDCNDIETLRSYAFRLQKENKQLKESYLLLSSRVSRIMPLIKDQLANWDWDSSDLDVLKGIDKAIDSSLSKLPKQTTSCLSLLDSMKIFRTSVYCCKFNPRDKVLACGCFSGSIILYRFSTSSMRLKHIRTITGHDGLVTSINWLQDNTHIVTTSVDKTVKVWKMMTGELEKEVAVDFLAMSSCLCSTMDSDICVVIGSSQSFLYIDMANRCIIKYALPNTCEPRRLDLHSQGEILVIHNSTYEIVNRITQHGYQIQSLYVKETQDGYYLAVSNRNNIIDVYQLNDTFLTKLSIPELKSACSNCVLFDDSNLSLSQVLEESEKAEEIEEKVIPNLYLITGGLAGVLYLWPVFRQNVFVKPLQIKAHNNSCCYIDYSSFCRLMATSAQDHNLIIWKASSLN